jgi:helix-turn-helix protein
VIGESKQRFSECGMKDVPVKIKHNNAWIVIKMGIGTMGFVIPPPVNYEVPFTSIIDLAEKPHTLVITTKEKIETTLKIKSVDKVLEVLKKLILNSCTAFRTVAYIKSMAIRDSLPLKNTPWEKGSIVVMSTGIWFVTQNRQVCVPISDVTSVESAKTDVKGTSTDIVRIDYIKSGEVLSAYVLCPLPTLQKFCQFLKDIMTRMDIKDRESDTFDQQVAMLIYSGMDSRAIGKMLNIPPPQLDAIYDKILNLGIAEVVATHRELQLTTKGIRFIKHTMKKREK